MDADLRRLPNNNFDIYILFPSALTIRFSEDVARPSQQHGGHAVVRADGPAVEKRLFAPPLHTGELLLNLGAETEFARNDFLGEIALADEQRHNKHPGRESAAQDSGEIGFLFPESFQHLREESAAPKFVRVLVSRRGRICVER